MPELLVGLVFIYIGYLVQRLVRTAIQTGNTPALGAVVPLRPLAEPQPAVAAAAPVVENTAPAAARKPRSSQVRPLKNPLTGETCAPPGNYRFARKWVKEALVTEGLLDHIYKTSELDEAASQQVMEALDALGRLEAYQG